LVLEAKGGGQFVRIESGTTINNPSVKSSDAFITVSAIWEINPKDDGKSCWRVIIFVHENRIPNERKGTVTFTAGNETKTLNITQKGKPKQ